MKAISGALIAISGVIACLALGILARQGAAHARDSIVSGSPALAPGVVCGASTPAPVAEYGISVASMPSGNYAADRLSPHFRNPPGSIASRGYWTTTPTKYLEASDHAYLSARSNYCSRDMEVDTWARQGVVYLRLTQEGDAIYFLHNGETPNGSLEIGVVKGLKEGVGFRSAASGAYYPLYRNDNLAGHVAAYAKSATEGQHFTFGVRGFDVYAKFNGVEFMRFKEYRHMASGRAAIQAPRGYSFRDITVRNLADRPLHSDYKNNVLDMRDFGLRSISTTGSVTAGSSDIALPADAGLKVGDYVIVETGKEPGKGLRGSRGVGGVWPAKSYPTLAVMQADTSGPTNLFAWNEDTSDVYQWSGTAWGQMPAKHYYWAKATPRALHARITAVSNEGRTITLDTPAALSVAGAAVHLDNAPIINAITGRQRSGGFIADLNPITPDNLTIDIPAGAFAIGGPISIHEHNGLVLQGRGPSATGFFTPKGTPPGGVYMVSSPASTVRAFYLHGNVRDHGFGLNWATGKTPAGIHPDGRIEYADFAMRAPLSEASHLRDCNGCQLTQGILMSMSAGDRAQDIAVADVYMMAVGTIRCTDCWGERIDSTSSDGLRVYTQWQIEWADSIGGGCIDCSVRSKYLIAGFAAFKARGTQFIRPKTVNAVMEMNTSGGFLYDSPTITITPMSQHPDKAFSAIGTAAIHINENVNNPAHPYLAFGGKIVNPHISVQGYINSDNNGLQGIIIGPYNADVTVEGGYIEGPDWMAPSTINPSVGLVSAATGTIVDGLRVVGKVNPKVWTPANIYLRDGVARNCVADLIKLVGPGARQENCVSNAQYLKRSAH